MLSLNCMRFMKGNVPCCSSRPHSGRVQRAMGHKEEHEENLWWWGEAKGFAGIKR